MCGIAGYMGQKNCEEVLLKFLKNLEYRGYDSAGIAIKKSDKIEIKKTVGMVDELIKMVNMNSPKTMGIAHTRWATNGGVEVRNTHPHLSQNNIWAIVHNGIIENYMELKNTLIANGVKFVSDTDSEVIAQMLEFDNVRDEKSFIECIKKLDGSYAVCAINKMDDIMYLAKKKTPLNIAISNDNEVYISSDSLCFSGLDCKQIFLEDGEFGFVKNSSVCVYDSNGKIVDKNPIQVINNFIYNGKENFNSFMEKEINEIPFVITEILSQYVNGNVFECIESSMNKARNINIIGCGTSYHSGLIGATYFKQFLHKVCQVYIASEFISSEPIIKKDDIYIFISQSGETADTMSALKMVKDCGCKTIVITNNIHSSMARISNYVLPVFAGPEIAVASTKAYNAQLMVLYLLARFCEGKKDFIKMCRNFADLDISYFYKIEEFTKNVLNADNVFILGKYKDYYTAQEASLKIREISYINCTAMPCGELKHGTLALVSKDSFCIVFLTNRTNYSKTMSAVNEIMARGGKVLLVSQFEVEKGCVDYFFKLPDLGEEIIDIISIIPFQILALKLSESKKINPDKPRNLAKSVTVE